jgi:apolipoprotein N-acyltransferase
MAATRYPERHDDRGKEHRRTTSRRLTSFFFAPWRLCVRFISALSSTSQWKLAFSGAVLLWASLPPLAWGFLAWVAPVPWVLLIRRQKLDGRRPYAMLWLAGFASWMGTLHFLRLPHWAASIGWVALSAYFAFYLPLFVGLSRVAVHRLRVPVMLAAPIVWTGLELVRGHLLTGMTMACLGHTQYQWIDLIQLSDLAGAYGVSFLVMFVAASLARMFPVACGLTETPPVHPVGTCRRTWAALWPLVLAVAVLVAAVLYGRLRHDENALSPGPRIALIQGSIDVEMRYDPGMRSRVFDEYYNLSREAVERNADIDLLIWPETMFLASQVTYEEPALRPAEFNGTDAEFQEWLPWIAERNKSLMAKTAQRLGVRLLLGVDTNHFGPDGVKCFNSAAYVDADGRLLGRYDKMHLVMFGEYVPFAQYFPWLQRLTPLPISATAGQRPAAFGLPLPGARASRPHPEAHPSKTPAKVRLAPNICYESVLSHVIRGQVNTLAAEGQEPDILVNLTNDGWFWGSNELDLHLICGVFRAIECRKPFLVAANTGFSAWIDSDGRIVEQGPRRDRAVLLAQPRLDRRRSWYIEHGDWFAGACLAACVLFAVVGFWGMRRKRDVSA